MKRKTISFAFMGVTGPIHLGHVRGALVCDAIARYERVKGEEVFFPIGAHPTGRGIGLILQKLKSGEDKTLTEYVDHFGGLPSEIPVEIAHFFSKSYLEVLRSFGIDFEERAHFTTLDEDYSTYILWLMDRYSSEGFLTEGDYWLTVCPECGPVSVDPSETDLKSGGNAIRVAHEYPILREGEKIVLCPEEPGPFYEEKGMTVPFRLISMHGLLSDSPAKRITFRESKKAEEEIRIMLLSEEVRCKCGQKVIVRWKNEAFINYEDPRIVEGVEKILESCLVTPPSLRTKFKDAVRAFPKRAFLREVGKNAGTAFSIGGTAGIIEAISDSTAYQYFYVLKYLQRTNQEGFESIDRELLNEVFFDKESNRRKKFAEFLPLSINLAGKEHLSVHFPAVIRTHAMLFENHLPYPEEFIITHYLTGEKGEKVSKSKGNAPTSVLELSPEERRATRIFLLHEGNPFQDISWNPNAPKIYFRHLRKIELNTGKSNPFSKEVWKSLKAIFKRNMDSRMIREAIDLVYFKIPRYLRMCSEIWNSLGEEILEEYLRMKHIFDPEGIQLQSNKIINFKDSTDSPLKILDYLRRIVTECKKIGSSSVRIIVSDVDPKKMSPEEKRRNSNFQGAKKTEKELLDPQVIKWIERRSMKNVTVEKGPSAYMYPSFIGYESTL